MDMLASKAESNRPAINLYTRLCDTTDMAQLERAGFQEMAIGDFFEEYQTIVKHIHETTKSELAQIQVLSVMQETMQSNAVVVHLRFLTSANLKKNRDLYEAFLIMDPNTMSLSQVTQFGEPDIESFCRMQVEARIEKPMSWS